MLATRPCLNLVAACTSATVQTCQRDSCALLAAGRARVDLAQLGKIGSCTVGPRREPFLMDTCCVALLSALLALILLLLLIRLAACKCTVALKDSMPSARLIQLGEAYLHAKFLMASCLQLSGRAKA